MNAIEREDFRELRGEMREGFGEMREGFATLHGRVAALETARDVQSAVADTTERLVTASRTQRRMVVGLIGTVALGLVNAVVNLLK